MYTTARDGTKVTKGLKNVRFQQLEEELTGCLNH